ncbi:MULTISPECIES: serine hydrolase domain-containing protein [Stenotrophomonas]|uniref:serine hydrolase domain-containing protein n=1 Tax=Stenotrophomonas TaxID=40323 RepID=UPI0012909106|nr:MULTISPECIES: serine hydrolase domain-containing protein [Stenotrophomonas]
MTVSSPDALSATPRLPAVDALLRQQHHDARLVGAVVLVRRHGQLLHADATGWADREQQRPMSRGTQFRLASVSKPIVTAAALRLVARGVLSLDTPAHALLPDFRPALADGTRPALTLRHLLSHSAGLGYRFLETDADGPLAMAGVSDGMDACAHSLQENVRRIAQVPLAFAPGHGWHYSLGVDVAGAMLEAATGLPLAEIVRVQVTAPLDMHDTGFHTDTPTRLATPYVSDQPRPRRLREGEVVPVFDGTVGIAYSLARASDPLAFASAGGGMVGTADDVMRLLEALRGEAHRDWLAATHVAEMTRAQVGEQGPPDPPGWGFGLGVAVLRDRIAAATPQADGSWRWGGAYGHSWFVDPACGLSVVALTNTLYEGMHGAFVDRLRDAVYADCAVAVAP